MDVRFLNCGTMRPRGASMVAPELAVAPCLCLLVETDDGLVLVDTGLGTEDVEDPAGRLGRSNILLNAQRDPEAPAVRQVAMMGLEPGDVRHVICTHLDRDHAGGLPDFPGATIHVSRIERDTALEPPTGRERERYRRCHFAHGPRWEPHDPDHGNKWMGLDVMRGNGLPGGLKMVALPGHTRGHCGVAVERDGGWLLHCGDSYYTGLELDEGGGVPAGVRAFRRAAHMDCKLAMAQLEKLVSALRESAGSLEVVASHDRRECERRAGGSR